MELLNSTFTLALASAISIIIAQALSRISVNYISMIIGIIIALIPLLNDQVAPFDSHVFMELIVAPLLFFEGQKTHIHNIHKNIYRILGITVIMVVIALIVGGFAAAWIGSLSLPIAFIISSISTPTDATATQSVTEGLRVPRRVNASLKAESLFNDASGIILLNMALLWFTNGYINYGQTIIQFLYASIGGALAGLILAWIIVVFRQFLVRTRFNSLNAQNILYIFTPFIIYIIAEHFKFSGIIAVVVAGLIHNAETQESLLINSRQIHMGIDLRDLISEIFNSMVFVILGVMIVRISRNRLFNHAAGTWFLVGAAIYLANVIVRYFYSLIILKFNNREAVVFAFGGVHGAVTLALALTLSASTLGNTNFNMIIMSEGVLILLSMLVATIIFQFILPHLPSEHEALKAINKIRSEMVKQALVEIHHMYLPGRVRRYVIYMLLTQKRSISTRESLKTLIKSLNQPTFTDQEEYLMRLAFFRAFAIERDYLEKISQKNKEYEDYLLDLYDNILLAQSLIIEPYDED